MKQVLKYLDQSRFLMQKHPHKLYLRPFRRLSSLDCKVLRPEARKTIADWLCNMFVCEMNEQVRIFRNEIERIPFNLPKCKRGPSLRGVWKDCPPDVAKSDVVAWQRKRDLERGPEVFWIFLKNSLNVSFNAREKFFCFEIIPRKAEAMAPTLNVEWAGCGRLSNVSTCNSCYMLVVLKQTPSHQVL